MKAFQRYSLWIIGWALIVYGVYDMLFSIHLMVEHKEKYQGQGNFKWFWETLFQFFGRIFQTFGMAFICLFLARICKLEDDPKFKDQLNQLIATLRTTGTKHD